MRLWSWWEKAAQSSSSPSEYLTPAGAFVSLVSSTGTYAPGAAPRAPGGPRAGHCAHRGGDPRPVRARRRRERGTQGHHPRLRRAGSMSPMSRISSTPAMHAGAGRPCGSLDPRTFQFTGAANYLNHPPMFYALLARSARQLEGHPQALLGASPDRCGDCRGRLRRFARPRSRGAFAAPRVLRLCRAAGAAFRSWRRLPAP